MADKRNRRNKNMSLSEYSHESIQWGKGVVPAASDSEMVDYLIFRGRKAIKADRTADASYLSWRRSVVSKDSGENSREAS